MAALTTARIALKPRASATPVSESVLAYSPRDGGDGEWLLIEFASVSSSPFKARLTWTNAGSDSGTVDLSVSRGTRVCIFAASVTIEAANLVNTLNTVSARISRVDFPVPTENVLDGYLVFAAAGDHTFDVPAYAKWVRLDVEAVAAKAGALLELIEPFTGTSFASYTLAEQPSPGVPVGDAISAKVTVTAATKVRITFGLTI